MWDIFVLLKLHMSLQLLQTEHLILKTLEKTQKFINIKCRNKLGYIHILIGMQAKAKMINSINGVTSEEERKR